MAKPPPRSMPPVLARLRRLAVASELFFALDDGMVFQIQLAMDRYAVPLTRDYLAVPSAVANRNERQPTADRRDRAS